MNETLVEVLPRQDIIIPKGKALWFTGLSGAGKTTLAKAFHTQLMKNDRKCIILDGDELRKGINAGLGFTIGDRTENIRRVAEIAKLLVNNGIISIVSTISPYPQLREAAKTIVGEESFFEIYINAPLSVCEKRDIKGLYKKARTNQIESFTGIHDDYIPPVSPDLEIRTDQCSIEESVEKLAMWFDRL